MSELRTAPTWLGAPTRSLRYAVYCRMFALASVARLTLPDALEDQWLPAHLAYWPGALLLAVNGALLGWVLCALGLALPLLLFGDQLTQSAYLLGCAACAIVCWAGPAKERERRMSRALPAAVRVLTAGTYGLAVLHKLNRDFLDPEVSCATGGLRILAENWGLPWLATASLDAVWPHLFLVVELGVVIALVLRPAAGMVVALLMHIPLTIVFAPAFAFVMISGWVCFVPEHDLSFVGRIARRRWKVILPLGIGLGGASFWLYMRGHRVVYPIWSLKETALWICVVWLLVAWLRRPAGVFAWWGAWRERIPRSRRWLPVAVGAAWLANGLLPYTGLMHHHTGAMLSNLRVDQGCWNSLVFPEAMRIDDPFVRIDEVDVGADVRGGPELRAIAREQLWHVRSLWRESRRWCAGGAGPLAVRGRRGMRPFASADLCDPDQWPLERPLLPGFAAHQDGLLRDCPQACVH